MNKFLPIGSIVKLKDDNNFEYMILGYYPIDQETDEKFDYAAVVYPQGYSYGNNLILFNKEDIENIEFKGYSDEENEFVKSNILEDKKNIFMNR